MTHMNESDPADKVVILGRHLRLSARDAEAGLSAVRGIPVTAARARLRLGPGRTCEPLARVLDRAIAEYEHAGRPVSSWVVLDGTIRAEEDILRVRRNGYGPADWIRSPVCTVRMVLGPAHALGTPTDAELPNQLVGPTTAAEQPALNALASHDEVQEALAQVIDPDLGISIVDLGFVRAVHVEARTAVITMTLTSAACPLSATIERQISRVLGDLSCIDHVRTTWQWIPAWVPDDATERGREQLLALGFRV